MTLNFSCLALTETLFSTDPEQKGALVDDYWGPGQKMMGDIKFLGIGGFPIKFRTKIRYLKIGGNHIFI